MITDPLHQRTRRQFFGDCGLGLGKIALGSLATGALGQGLRPAQAPKAKRVVYLFQAGAPSQLDLFDPKPELTKLDGKPLPKSVTKDAKLAFIQPDAGVLAPQFEFKKHGESGMEISSVLPHLSGIVDEVAFIRSVHTEQFNHSPAQLFVNTGHPIPGRPAMGSWLSYGIGSEADDLPAFIVLKSGGNLSGGAAMWSSGFLPSQHQGVPFRSQGDPILHVANPKGYDEQAQREAIDTIRSLNEGSSQVYNDPEIEARISAYEMAYRMQSRAPELMDFSQESEATLEMYGAKPGDGSKSYANNCLLARRLLERGSRFVQLYHSGWDHHSNVAGGLTKQCAATDQASAALVMDLKQRGLLDDTLVVWGGEFGRTPMVESSTVLGRSKGRDHHPHAYTMWMAGGGIKGGVVHGQTDDLGYNIVENPVHVHDLQATILHLLGIDHERLTYIYQGRPFRLTDVHGHVVKEILA